MAERNLDYLGRGWSFPFGFSAARGGVRRQVAVATAAEVDKVKMAISQILGTRLGSRPMARSFGSRLRELIHHPIGEDLKILLQHYSKEAIETWEPRVSVGLIEVSDLDRAQGRIDITVNFTIKASYEPGSLVFPFYLPDEEKASWATAFESANAEGA